jgi:predicted dehydrogenase
MQRTNGMKYAPTGKYAPVCGKGEFRFAAVGLDHGHIYGMCNGLLEAGAELVGVADPDPEKVAAFCQTYPQVSAASSVEQLLEVETIHLIASASVPADRGPFGVRVMEHGKDYFADKPPFTTLAQLDQARRKTAETQQKYFVYYSERLHVESAVLAGQLIEQGAIGRVLQVIGLGPHRLNLAQRPAWFFQRARYGGILCDIGSHQIEQFLAFANACDARVTCSHVANYHHKQYPELEDFGDAALIADNGATNYFRVDWFTPDGLGVWGDGRTFILGTDGYIELRKYCDVARDAAGDQVYLVTQEAEQHFAVHGQVGFPFFGQLLRDCLDRTTTAMSQEHAFKAAELCLHAQQQAERIE